MLLQDKKALLADLRFGPYVSPVIAIGVVVECEAHGMVTVVAPVTAQLRGRWASCDGERQLVVFKSLARALRRKPGGRGRRLGRRYRDSVPLADGLQSAATPQKANSRQPADCVDWREDDDIIAHVSLRKRRVSPAAL